MTTLPAECTFTTAVGPGSRGRRARLVQEWLPLHGVQVAVDGRFGPATAAAVAIFQEREGVRATGTVDEATFARLVAPIGRILRPIAPPADGALGPLVAACALQHLAERPREVGGQNRGPWVRLYLHGAEGREWPWCAGFATFVVAQAARTLGRPLPLPLHGCFSCDLLAERAAARGLLVRERDRGPTRPVAPGSIFLSRRAPRDWVHAGVVLRAEPAWFESVEGNTNDAGDREGYEVCARMRGYAGKDFVMFDG